MREKPNFQVYRHTNLENGKVYIGATSSGWESRWKTKYKKNKKLRQDIANSSEAQWRHEILSENLTLQEARTEELRQIKLHDATNPDRGYNRRLSTFSEADEEAWAKKMENHARAMKRVYDNPVYHKKLSENRKLQNQRYQEKLRSMTESERAKEAKLRSDRSKRGAATIRRKMAEDRDYAKHIEEIRSAFSERMSALWRDPVYRANRTKPRAGYVPVLPELAHKHKSEAQKKIWSRPGYREAMSKKMRDAMNALSPEAKARLSQKQRELRLGTEHSDDTIRKIAETQRKRWTEGTQLGNKGQHIARSAEANDKTSKTLSARTGKPVKCIETGIIYPSINVAARALGCTDKDIKDILSHKRKTTHGYSFEYAGQPQEVDNAIKVVCMETGVTYNSIKEAATATGATSSGISSCCSGRRKTSGGFHWAVAK